MSEYKHSSEEHGWVTPPEVIEMARQAMGSIDLDPASSVKANKIVKAKRIYTEPVDGLKCKWSGNVWLNPPFGTLVHNGKLVSSQALWMTRCIHHWKEGSGAIPMMITLFNAATSAKWFRPLWKHAIICFPHSRIQFLDPVTFTVMAGNQYASAIAGWVGDSPSADAFYEAFKGYGTIVEAY